MITPLVLISIRKTVARHFRKMLGAARYGFSIAEGGGPIKLVQRFEIRSK
jgi:hypothetical protein